VKRDVTTLKGDCTAHIPDGRVLDVPVIDCAKPRREEVYAVLTLSGSKYPARPRSTGKISSPGRASARAAAVFAQRGNWYDILVLALPLLRPLRLLRLIPLVVGAEPSGHDQTSSRVGIYVAGGASRWGEVVSLWLHLQPGCLLSSVHSLRKVDVIKAQVICLVRRHQWYKGWDEERHLTVWTCKRCGKTRASSDEMGDPTLIGGPGGGG
jgi:hypothetical protein